MRAPLFPCIALVALAAAGCGLDFQSFLREGPAPGTDGGASDGAPREDAGVVGADVVDLACAYPQLLVTVEDVSNTGPTGGSVARFALTPDGPQRCADLTGRGSLPSQPISVAEIPGAGIAVASYDGVDWIDPATDAVLARWRSGGGAFYPMDVFRLRSAEGEWLTAVAYTAPGGDTARGVQVFRADGTSAFDWPTNAASGPAALGLAVYSMTRSPLDPTHFLAISRRAGVTSYDVAPFMDGARTLYHTERMGESMHTVYVAPGDSRVVYVGGDFATPTGVFYSAAGMGALDGPVSCSSAPCAGRELVHVVPDASNAPDGLIAVCEGGGIARHVVRFRATAGACTEVLDGTANPRHRISRLGVATGDAP